jgi:hypothetical protein
MLLDLSRALSFFVSIVALDWATLGAFFAPGSRLEDRLVVALLRLGLAGCACFLSGLLFSWPSRTARRGALPLTSTLPVQLFFWALGAITLLFIGSWYLASYPGAINVSHDCSL